MESEIFKEMKEDLALVLKSFDAIENMKDKLRADFEIDRLKTTIEALPEEIANANVGYRRSETICPTLRNA